MNKKIATPEQRRSFLTRFNAGAASLAALAFGSMAMAQTKPAGGAFQPEKHAQDDWMDQVPGKHRMVIDTTSQPAFGNGSLFASNFIIANKDYGLEAKDIAIILVVRHQSTGLGYNNAMWAKYGATLAQDLPAAMRQPAPTANPAMQSVEGLVKQGIQFAVCGMATKRLAGMIATATNSKPEDILKELSANLVPNARLAAAGIVAVNRAQERGYTLVTATA